MNLYPNWRRKNFLWIELCIAAVMMCALLIRWKQGSGADILKNVVRGSGGQICGTMASISVPYFARRRESRTHVKARA